MPATDPQIQARLLSALLDWSSAVERSCDYPALFVDATGFLRPLSEIEGDAIVFAVRHCNGNMCEVARRLRIGRATLYRKLKQLGLR